MSPVNYTLAIVNPKTLPGQTPDDVCEGHIVNDSDLGVRRRNVLSDCGGADYKYMNSENVVTDTVERNIEGSNGTINTGVGD
ncbi:hypothetical protein CsSME_00004743 [Camellia sinensis var. sinensis]